MVRWNTRHLRRYAPLPESVYVLVAPPKAFVEAGLVKPGETWLLQKAVYGLRIAPKAWGKERDRVFRNLTWKADGEKYCLKQCEEDTQVWKITKENSDEVLGLIVVYVDDFLLLSKKGKMRENLKGALAKQWAMKEEVELEEGMELNFLGLQMMKEKTPLMLRMRSCICSTVRQSATGAVSPADQCAASAASSGDVARVSPKAASARRAEAEAFG